MGRRYDAHQMHLEVDNYQPATIDEEHFMLPRFPLLVFIATVVLMSISCGTSTLDTAIPAEPTLIPTLAPIDTPTLPTPPEPNKGPTGNGADTTLSISTVGDNLKFDLRDLLVIAGEEVELRFENMSSVNQHNWVLVKDLTKDEVSAAGLAAGPNNDWIPLVDERVIAHTELLEPGTTGVVRFTAPAPGRYEFVCTFPGHNAAGMFGFFEVTQASQNRR